MLSSLYSDQGANLTSHVISSLCRSLGIERTQTTAYHSQGNGQVERFNHTLEANASQVSKGQPERLGSAYSQGVICI